MFFAVKMLLKTRKGSAFEYKDVDLSLFLPSAMSGLYTHLSHAKEKNIVV